MNNSTTFIIFTFVFCLCLWFNSTDNPKINGRMPIPTEYVEKKSKRKDFKQQRKQYMKNMHRAHPDTDWEKMDMETRQLKTQKVQERRKELFVKGNWSPDLKGEEVLRRDLVGIWHERGSNNLSGRIRTTEIDWENNLIYCGSSGGNIWRGTLEGEDWTSLNDYLQIKGMTMLRLVEFGSTRRLLIGSGGNFYYTDNEGATLEQSTGLDFLSDWGSVKRNIVKESDQSIYLLANEWDYSAWHEVGAIYKSVDFGESFIKIMTLNSSSGFSSVLGSGHFDIWTSRYFVGDVYMLHNDEFYRIDNSDELEYIAELPVSGSNENLLTGGMGLNNPFFYAHVGNRIYHSMNSGTTWVDKGERPQWWFTINSFNSSNIDREQIYFGGMEAFRSSSSGNSWTLVNNWWDYYGNEANRLHADIPEIRLFLNPDFNEVALISTDGGIYFSDDGLQTVHNLSMSGLGVSQYYSTYSKRTAPYHVYAGAQDQGFQRSLYPGDGVLDFDQSISGDYGHLVSGDDGQTIWCNYPGFTMYYQSPLTDTGGETLNFPGYGHLWLAPLMADPYASDKAYLGGGGLSGGNHLFHLSMGNWSISYEEESYSFSGTVSAIAFSPLEPEHRYVLTSNGNFYHSSNDGDSWQMSSGFNGPDAHYFYGSTIWASESVPGKVIVGGSGYSNPPVYVSYNHGVNFEPFSESLPSTLVYKLAGTPEDDYYFAATEVGPYVYIAADGEWVDMAGISAPDQTYWSVEYIPELATARFGTYGRGIWDFAMNESPIIDGDVTLDETVNIQDIVLLVNFILGVTDPSNDQFSAGDTNDDGSLNILDVIEVVNIILGE